MFLKISRVCRKDNRTDLYVKVYVSDKGTLIFRYRVNTKESSSGAQAFRIVFKFSVF